ncbi:MAG: hypothetical protein AAFR83_17820 [Cyanobacteria bacterium J06629_18]
MQTNTVTNEYLKTICGNNNIAKCVEDMALWKFNQRSINTNNFAAFCLYYAFKACNVPRTLTEVSKMCFVTQSDIIKYEREENQRPIKPSDLTSRACYRLGLDNFQLQMQVSAVADEIYKTLLRNSPPQSVLAITLYVLSSILKWSKRIKRDTAWACHVSISCVRRLYRIYKADILEIVASILQEDS